MKVVVLVALAMIAAAAAIVFSVVALQKTRDEGRAVGIEPLTTLAAPVALTKSLPVSWMAGLQPAGAGEAVQLSCLDADASGDADGMLSAADNPEYGELQITLDPEKACQDPERQRDYYAGLPSDGGLYVCGAQPAPALVVAIGSAGTNLLDPSSGESTGLLALINDIRARADDAGISTLPIISTAAIFGGDSPQNSMEKFLSQEIGRRLGELPCLRAVLIGHSHGGATVTAVTAALDERYADRVFGVLLDRSTVLYDRPETEMPARTKLLNVYQLNQGWHGVPLALPNVYNIDQSYEYAPRALSDGGGDPEPVGHKTLDDSPGVQRIIADAVVNWLIPR